MEASVPPSTRLAALRRSESAAAAGLAAATIVQQGAAVVFTVVFTRVLGTDGYGALAALVNFTVIMLVPGSALQVAVARQGTLGRLGGGAELAATLRRWTVRLLGLLAAVSVVAALAREPLAGLVNVDQAWAAAAVPATATLWLLVCVQRGLLLSAGAYRAVGTSLATEGVGRIVTALALTAAGLGVTGAYLGLGLAYGVIALALASALARRLAAPGASGVPGPATVDLAPAPGASGVTGPATVDLAPATGTAGLGPATADPAPAMGTVPRPAAALLAPDRRLRAVARTAAVPIAGLILVAALQNVDVIMARRALAADPAGVYAATTVAAKAIVWIAVGVGLWVLPETTRRAAAGQDPRTVLWRALTVIGVLTVPALILFALVPSTILRLAFGAEYTSGADVLLPLGAAFALLAAASVGVQYLLGLHRRRFVLGLLVVAVAEPLVLAGADSLADFAGRVLAVQAVAAVLVLGAAVRARQDERPGEPGV